MAYGSVLVNIITKYRELDDLQQQPVVLIVLESRSPEARQGSAPSEGCGQKASGPSQLLPVTPSSPHVSLGLRLCLLSLCLFHHIGVLLVCLSSHMTFPLPIWICLLD